MSADKKDQDKLKEKLTQLQFDVTQKEGTEPPFDDAAHAGAQEFAYFAGGCFWCVEVDFLKVKGVIDAESGYIGGDEKNPNYETVSAGKTGHTEAVKVTFDPALISYSDLLKVFWLSIDPTVVNRQFCDVGTQYRTAIFYTSDDQAHAIEASLAWLKKEFSAITPVTEIAPARQFYRAEEYHQRYADKNPIRYNFYRFSCGRDGRLKELFGDKRALLLKDLVQSRR